MKYIVITSSEESLGNGDSVKPSFSIVAERTKCPQREMNGQNERKKKSPFPI